jgi:hypothetical protein
MKGSCFFDGHLEKYVYEEYEEKPKVFFVWTGLTSREPHLLPGRLKPQTRARICKRLWSPGIDSEESILPAHVACRAGTTNRVVPTRQAGNQFLGSWKGLQIWAQSQPRLGYNDFNNLVALTRWWFPN